MHQLLDLPRVLEITTLKRSTLYARVKAVTFPAPRKIGARRIAFHSKDVESWIESQQAASAA